MTNEEKAKELGIKYQTPCHGIGDCEFEARQAALEMAEWKDKQMIDKSCEFIAEWFYEHPHAQMVCSDEFETVDKLLDRFEKAMKGGKE